MLDDPAITDIAGRLRKSPAQVVLRWQIERGNIVMAEATAREIGRISLEEALALTGRRPAGRGLRSSRGTCGPTVFLFSSASLRNC